jgi:guanidinoacetate N-methyltransferase
MEPAENYITPFEDARMSTYKSRIDIGFSERDAWRDAAAQFDEHSLTVQGHPVMEDWEDGYMKELARIATQRGGTVLEIGFGMGISAGYVQQSSIDHHIIIEANEDIFFKLEKFAASSSKGTTPLLGFWEDLTHKFPSGSISGILFDTYPLREEEIHSNHFPFFKEACRLLATGGILTYYSDEIDSYSEPHLAALARAGFTDISSRICSVSPSPNCQYWNSSTLLVPIIRK